MKTISQAAGALLLLPLAMPPDPSDLPVELHERKRQGIRFLQGQISTDRVDPDYGHVVLDFTPIQATRELHERIETAQEGERFAVSPDFAANIDTSIPLQIGDEELDPGLYFVLIEKGAEGWSLVLVDSEKARERRWNGRGAPSFVEGRVLDGDWEFKDRPNRADSNMVFGLPGGARAIVLNVWIGDLHLWAEIEASAKKGRAAGWVDDGRRATWRGPIEPGDELRGPVVSVDCGGLPWDEPMEAFLEEVRRGDRFFATRMFWATLISNVPVAIGDDELEPGEYSLALERRGREAWSLFVLESEKRRKKLLDPYNLDKARPSMLVPLEYASDGAASSAIDFGFAGSADAPELAIRYGPHHWSAPLALGAKGEAR